MGILVLIFCIWFTYRIFYKFVFSYYRYYFPLKDDEYDDPKNKGV